MPDGNDQIRLVRIIARLNIGGPAIQAISLTRLLEPRGYRTRLVRGREAPSEGNMDYLAERLGVQPTLIPSMRREPGPGDLTALLRLVSILRRERPQIVHTHAAKAGTLGRIATLLAFPGRRPVLVHTFHGHSLTGYFSGRTAGFYRSVERTLAKRTDILIAVSTEVRDDLVSLGVAPRDQFVVVPLGFDLSPFLNDTDREATRAALREEWGISPGQRVVTLVARLVPIKRVDRFLRVARRLAADPDTREDIAFVVVGDGELAEELRGSPDAQALGPRIIWAGFRRDMPDVCFASDVVMLTSDNEGTPVSLIEAQAAAVPVVSTAVGGVPSAVLDGQTGRLADVGDEAGLARACAELLSDRAVAESFGRAAREHAAANYQIERLVDDHDRLYRRLLSRSDRD